MQNPEVPLLLSTLERKLAPPKAPQVLHMRPRAAAQLNILRRIYVAVACTLLLSAGVAALVWYQLAESAEVRKNLVLAYDMKTLTLQTLSMLEAAETGQRGYIITKDKAFLTSYMAARNDVPGYIQTLIARGSGNAHIKNLAYSLAILSRDRMDELTLVITLQDKQGAVAASTRIAEGRGQRIMSELRTVSANLLAHQEIVIKFLSQEQSKRVLGIRITIALLVLGIVLLALATAWLTGVYQRQRERALAEIRKSELINTAMALVAEVSNRSHTLVEALSRTTAALKHTLPEAAPMAWVAKTNGTGLSWTPVQPIVPGSPWAGYVMDGAIKTPGNCIDADVTHALATVNIQSEKLAMIGLSAQTSEIEPGTLRALATYSAEQLTQLAARERAEEQLKASIAQQLALFDGALDAIVVVSSNGHIISMNRSAQQMFVTASQDSTNLDFAALIDTAEGKEPPTFAGIRRYADGGGRVSEITAKRQDGETFSAELALSEVKLHRHSIYIAVFRDITDRRKAEQAKREFISTVSHELRTPLTSIAGSLKLLLHLSGKDLAPDAARLVNIADRNTQRLVKLVNEILDIDKLEAGKMSFTLTDAILEDVIDAVVEAISPMARDSGVSIQVVHEDAQTVVRTDTLRFSQALTNLLSNAIKFSPKGGIVQIRISLTAATALIAVNDSGPGIPPDFISRVFSKFSQATGPGLMYKGGTGLGLSIVKEIVDQLGGKVSFDTGPSGTTFYIELSLPGDVSVRDPDPPQET